MVDLQPNIVLTLSKPLKRFSFEGLMIQGSKKITQISFIILKIDLEKLQVLEKSPCDAIAAFRYRG